MLYSLLQAVLANILRGLFFNFMQACKTKHSHYRRCEAFGEKEQFFGKIHCIFCLTAFLNWLITKSVWMKAIDDEATVA